MRLVFVDTETTGLDPTTHVPWDIAVIEVDGTERVWTWRPCAWDVDQAQPKALEVGRFEERAPDGYELSEELDVAAEVAEVLAGTILVGQNPEFDRRMLSAWLEEHGHTLDVHYRSYDMMMMSAGWVHGFRQARADRVPPSPPLGDHPWSSYELSTLVGVDPPGDDAHTAVGDARWVRRMWLAMTGADGGS